MKNANKVSGAAIATAAALLFSNLAVSTASAEEAKVHCAGVNACKGAGACKTAANECKGQNACKGKGFVELTDKECKAEQAKLKKG
jgi:hypothetical protein